MCKRILQVEKLLKNPSNLDNVAADIWPILVTCLCSVAASVPNNVAQDMGVQNYFSFYCVAM